MGTKIWKDVKYLKSLINTEFKHIDVSVATAATEGGVVTPISEIALGDDFDDRTGRSIKLTSLSLKWSAEMHTSATGTLDRSLVIDETYACIKCYIRSISSFIGTEENE